MTYINKYKGLLGCWVEQLSILIWLQLSEFSQVCYSYDYIAALTSILHMIYNVYNYVYNIIIFMNGNWRQYTNEYTGENSMTGNIERGNLSKSGKRKCHNQLLHQLQRSMPIKNISF